MQGLALHYYPSNAIGEQGIKTGAREIVLSKQCHGLTYDFEQALVFLSVNQKHCAVCFFEAPSSINSILVFGFLLIVLILSLQFDNYSS